MITAAAAWISGEKLRYLDERDYHGLALRLLEGSGYTTADLKPTAFRPPGYPVFLAGVYGVWNSPLAAKMAQAMLLALLAWMLGSLVAVEFPIGRALPALLILLYPVLLYTATTLYPQTLGAVLLSAIVHLLVHPPGFVPRPLILAGVLTGILTLLIPSFLTMIPLLAVYLIHVRRRAPWRAVAGAVLFVAATVMTLSPWLARNALRFGEFVPISTNSGRNLYLGNSDLARPNLGVNLEIPEEERANPQWGELQTDRHYRHLAIQWMRKHPGRAFTLYLGKWLAHFHYRNTLFTAGEAGSLRDLVMFLTYYPLLCTGLLRLCRMRRHALTGAEGLCYLLYFGNAFLSAVFFPRIRFRLPFDALLIACVAMAAARGLKPAISAASPAPR